MGFTEITGEKVALGAMRLSKRPVSVELIEGEGEASEARLRLEGALARASDAGRLDQVLEALDASLSKLEALIFEEGEDERTLEDPTGLPEHAIHPVAFIDPEVLSIIEESPSCALPDFEERVRTMIRFQEAGDTAGALDAATEIFVRLDGEGTGYFVERFGRILSFACRRRLGALTGCPTLTMDPGALLRLPLDRRTGFLLSMVDGQTTLQDLILLSGMHEAEALCLLTRLASWSVISTATGRW